MLKNILIGASALLMLSCASNKPVATSSTPKKEQSKSPIKPYSDIITKEAVSDAGLFTIHRIEDDYFFEIPDSLLDQEILMVTRISGSTPELSFGGAGMKAQPQQVIRFERKGNAVLLRHVSYTNTANPDEPIYESVQLNNFEPVLHSFPIKSLGADSTGLVIEVNDFFRSDSPILSPLDKGDRKRFEVRALDKSRSFIDTIRSFPENIEVRHVMTWAANNPPDDRVAGSLSLEMNQSFIQLPKDPMRPRLYDDRVGFFSIEKYDYSSERQKADKIRYITRWRLEPKDPEAYARGELVEPIKPIVYYVDRATPERWKKYIKLGIEDWQSAFEKAGFKNAIIAKDAPTAEEDPDFSPEDVRYSVVRYITTPIQNAQGPHVHDPRTGEILESDILWYHNITNLLRNWYFVQTAAANPLARKTEIDEEIMGELVRFVSAHEVGHTLGYPHNWGSSVAYPVDSLRSRTFTNTHGTAPSIMDYARFNYVAQPEDGVTQFFPQIGEYDDWVTQWGYTYFPTTENAQEDKKILDNWVKNHLDSALYFYGAQTISKVDPRAQNEDLGDNSVKAGTYGMMNLFRIMKALPEYTAVEGETYDDLNELYGQILGQWYRYMGHAIKNIGGIYVTPKVQGQEGNQFEAVPLTRQKEAVDFVSTYAFSTPDWMMNQDVLGKIDYSNALDRVRSLQSGILRDLLNPERIARILSYEAFAKGERNVYTATSFMDDVRMSIFTELKSRANIDPFRRNLQRVYVDRLDYLLNDFDRSESNWPSQYYFLTSIDGDQSDLRALAREQLTILKKDLTNASYSRRLDRSSKAHIAELQARIDRVLNPEQ